jgi:hypothetical protein
MNAAVIAAAGITALTIFFLLAEGDSLTEGHARLRTHALNAGRWALVMALSWLLIPVTFSQTAPTRLTSVLGLAALIVALMLVPVRWFVRLGGREPAWELRRAKIELSQLANKLRLSPGSVPAERLTDVGGRIKALRTSDNCELCDLMAAAIDDLTTGSENWNEAGRRSIRIDELSRELWPGEMPAPEFDREEATFRWLLYRDFGRMIDIGNAVATPDSKAELRRLAGSLESYRREDTAAFIDDVQRSARAWAGRSGGLRRRWIASFDFSALGPNGPDEVRELWGRDAALWGARFDAADLQALADDMARRSAVTPPKPEGPASAPTEAAEAEPAVV